jgi:serine/threonine protein kinase
MFTTAAKVSMGLQICAGLAELAALSMLHRDLAARNVLVHRMHPVHVKICDFGMARRASGGGERGGGERGGASAMQASALVPLRWLPPECMCGVPQWSAASDVWALGARPTLHCTTSGARVHRGLCTAYLQCTPCSRTHV